MSKDDPNPEELLDRAYHVSNTGDMHALYRDWAETYDDHLIDHLQYSAPDRVAALLQKHCQGADKAVVDIGCGTGLTGEALVRQGFNTLDGIDFSPEMLIRARSKGIYRDLIEADLTRTLDIPDAHYEAAASSGTFTHAHVGAQALDEIFRILKPGGVLVCSVNQSVWDPMGFASKVEELTAAGTMETLAIKEAPLFSASSEDVGNYCVFRKT